MLYDMVNVVNLWLMGWWCGGTYLPYESPGLVGNEHWRSVVESFPNDMIDTTKKSVLTP